MKSSVYMTWAKRHAAATYNLANSGILGCNTSDFQAEADDFSANGANAEGYPPLKIAIAQKYGLGVEGVVLAQGTSGANYLACATLLDRGDEVLVEQPTYEPILAVVGSLGAQVRRFPRAFESRYQIDPDAIEKLLTPRTRLVILTSPHNPSGVTVEQGCLRDLAGRCSRRGVYLLVDEVYRDILFEDAPPSAVHLAPFAVATSSLTKSYGLSGLRCGWILCGEEAAERMRRMNDLMGVAGAFPAEHLGWAAFRRLDQLEARSRGLIEPSSRLVHRFLEEHADLLDCVVPERSMTVFPRLKLGENSDLLHDRLRRRETSIVPGRFFEASRHFRLGFGVKTEDVAAGLSRLSETLREIS